MTNDDPMYLRHLEQALEAAELEIKGLEGELRKQDKILAEIQEQLAPTRMGEPMIRNCSLTDNVELTGAKPVGEASGSAPGSAAG